MLLVLNLIKYGLMYNEQAYASDIDRNEALNDVWNYACARGVFDFARIRRFTLALGGARQFLWDYLGPVAMANTPTCHCVPRGGRFNKLLLVTWAKQFAIHALGGHKPDLVLTNMDLNLRSLWAYFIFNCWEQVETALFDLSQDDPNYVALQAFLRRTMNTFVTRSEIGAAYNMFCVEAEWLAFAPLSVNQ